MKTKKERPQIAQITPISRIRTERIELAAKRRNSRRGSETQRRRKIQEKKRGASADCTDYTDCENGFGINTKNMKYFLIICDNPLICG